MIHWNIILGLLANELWLDLFYYSDNDELFSVFQGLCVSFEYTPSDTYSCLSVTFSTNWKKKDFDMIGNERQTNYFNKFVGWGW
jgi:hypothetical protein